MIKTNLGIHQFVCGADFSRLHQGFAPGGPQDRFSCRFANLLLGNEPDAGAIEFTLVPAAFEVTRDCHLVVGGAECEISVDGREVPQWTVLAVDAGSMIRINIGPNGCRVYVCVAGGLNADLEWVGDGLSAEVGRRRSVDQFQWEPKLGSVRAMVGPEATETAIAQLVEQVWTVSPQSSSMGVRLQGAALTLPDFDIQSSPVQDGTVQATESGLIGLLRQRGTLGGYPRVATIIDCDVDRLAQFGPGNRLRFEIVDRVQAAKLCQQQALDLRV